MFATLAVFFSACTPVHMFVPPEVTPTYVPVAGRQGWQVGQTITFADVTVDRIERYGSAEGFSFVGLGTTEAQKVCSFDVRRGERMARIGCVSTLATIDFQQRFGGLGVTSTLESKHAYVCERADDGGRGWRLLLMGADAEHSSGVLEIGDTRYEVVDQHKMEVGSVVSFQALGYSFRQSADGKVVGLVETVNDGRVWMDESLDHARFAIPAAAAALLSCSGAEKPEG